MKRIFYSMALALMALMVSIPTQAGRVYNIASEEEWNYLTAWHQSWNGDLLGNDDIIRLAADINATYTEGETSGSVSTHGTMTIDLNGHTIRIEGAASAMASIIYLFEGSTLNIMDSRQGGQMIFDDIDGGGESCLFYMHENTTLNIYGGTLLTTYHNNFSSRCYTVNIPSTTNTSTINIYGGQLSGINQNINNNSKNIRVNLYGGIIGSQDNITYERPALYHNPCIGIIKAGKIYGLYGYAALADYIQGTAHQECALAENTEVYIDGVLTPSNQLVSDRDAYENKLVEVFYEPDFTINNVAVTSANAADILGDGKLSFDLASNTLNLRSSNPNNVETLSGNIVFDGFTLNIVVDGKWRLNGRIVGHNGNLVISAAHPQVMVEENADYLGIHANSTPVSLNGKGFTAKHRVAVYIDDNNNYTQSAVSCGMFAINNAWFDAWGKKPVVDCQNSMIQNATIKTGSLNNDVIQIEPNIQKYVVWVDAYDKNAGTATGDGYVPEGTEHTVSATPKDGYHFLRWSNGVTKNPYTFVVTQDTVLWALFEKEVVINYYDIRVASADETMGWVEGGALQLEQGQKVTIKAYPRSGYEFLYWMDSREQVQSGDAIYEVTVSGDETYTAHFRVQPPADAYNLWVCGTQVTGSNSRDILGDGVWSYDDATRTLTVMKDATYNITNDGFIEDWAGSGTDEPLIVNVGNHKVEAICTTTDNTLRNAIVGTKGMTFTGTTYHGVTLTAQNMYAANFSKPLTVTGHMDLTLNLKNTTDWGKDYFKTAVLLSSSTPSIIVDGANLYINSGVGESAGSGYKATNKTDQAANLSLINAVVDDGSISAKSLYISDNSPKYEINYITPSLESLCLTSVFGLSFFEGTYVDLRAYPATGYKFVSWSDGNTDNPRLIIMPAQNVYLDPIVEVDESIVPKGAIINANVTEGQGTITNFTSGWYAEGTELTITAEPAEGYEFVQWSDGHETNPYYLTVEDGKNINITALFCEKGQGIENIQVEGDQPQKIMMDGILYIVRDGKIYNAQGANVK